MNIKRDDEGLSEVMIISEDQLSQIRFIGMLSTAAREKAIREGAPLNAIRLSYYQGYDTAIKLIFEALKIKKIKRK